MPIGMYGRPVYYAPIPYAPMYAASAPPAPGGGSPPTGYSPRSVAEWQRYYAKPQQPYPYYGAYVSPPYSQTPSALPSAPPEEPPPPPSRKRNRYTTTYKQGQSTFVFKGTAANIPETPADDTVQHFTDARGRTTARSPSKRDVSPVTSPRGTTRFRIKPGAYDNLFPSSPEAADDGSVEKGDGAVPPALLERFRALDAAETRKRAESDVQSAASSPRTITSPGSTPPASPPPPSRARPVWSGVCDDDASWAKEPAPAETGFVHQGEIFFSPGKPVVVPTPRSSRGSKFDLPSPSTAIRVLKNDLF